MVEPRIVIPVVVGSSPISHPTILKYILPWMRGIVVGCVGSVSVFQYGSPVQVQWSHALAWTDCYHIEVY